MQAAGPPGVRPAGSRGAARRGESPAHPSDLRPLRAWGIPGMSSVTPDVPPPRRRRWVYPERHRQRSVSAVTPEWGGV